AEDDQQGEDAGRCQDVPEYDEEGDHEQLRLHGHRCELLHVLDAEHAGAGTGPVELRPGGHLRRLVTVALATRTFQALGTTAQVCVTEPRTLDDAAAVVEDELAAIDLACSRFRGDSE